MGTDRQRWHAHQAALYLGRVKGMADRIKSLNLSIDELEAAAAGIRPTKYEEDRVQVSPAGDALPDKVARLVELKEDRERRRLAYEAELDAVMRSLDRMPDQTLAAMLEMHYIGGAAWQRVADELSYTKSGVLKAKTRALAMFYDHMPPSQRSADVPRAL